MSIEQAMILRAQPQMVQRKLRALINQEVCKGCLPDIYPTPVRLEPRFAPLFSPDTTLSGTLVVPDDEVKPSDQIGLRIWVSPEQNCEWNRSEFFLKLLSAIPRRICFNILGNKQLPKEDHARRGGTPGSEGGISIEVACHPQDEPTIAVLFRGKFDKCEINRASVFPPAGLFDSGQMLTFVDVYPPPPYSHLLTSYEELKTTPFASLLECLAAIPPPSIGFYQCVFQPVDPLHDWHKNVEGLLDVEYMVKLNNGQAFLRQLTQQAPSGDLHQMAHEVVTKAHNDKPFFCTAVRIGIIGPAEMAETSLATVSAFIRVFQHGGRPLKLLTHRDYERVLSAEAIRRMIAYGTTYRPGFLVNSRELTGLVHLFSPKALNPWRISVDALETLPVRNEALSQGTLIGTCEYAGATQNVCIPYDVRERSTHVIGAHGTGKSTILLNSFYQDVHERDMGAALIDFHGDTVKEALRIIEPRLYDKCIYFNPGDPEWIPLWNPLRVPPRGDIYRQADDIIAALHRVFDDWGDRMETLLRNGLIGLSRLPSHTFLDLYMLTRQKSQRSDELRRQIVKLAIDEPVRAYWETDFLKDYTRGELVAAKHKLSKLLSAGSPSLMLSQPESLFNLRQVMDERKILLVDLSMLGRDVAKVLGSFILALFLTATTGRSDSEAGSRQPFSLFVDEAHLFADADAIEHILSESRKFKVNLMVAHQYLAQWRSTGRVDALSTVGCTLIGHMDKRDSEYFSKDCQDIVDPVDIMRLKPFEIIARIGSSDVVRVQTAGPRKPVAGDGWRAIIEASHSRYCRRAAAIRAALASGSDRWVEPFSPLQSEGEFTDEDLKYDEF